MKKCFVFPLIGLIATATYASAIGPLSISAGNEWKKEYHGQSGNDEDGYYSLSKESLAGPATIILSRATEDEIMTLEEDAGDSSKQGSNVIPAKSTLSGKSYSGKATVVYRSPIATMISITLSHGPRHWRGDFVGAPEVWKDAREILLRIEDSK